MLGHLLDDERVAPGEQLSDGPGVTLIMTDHAVRFDLGMTDVGV